jgi:broad specificity phosphatase PhoE
LAPTLWLVRHAPTAHNHDGVIMGQRDPDATVEGLDVAAGLLAEVAFEHVVSSDARRARETARAIAPDVRTHLDARLRERFLGPWEGRTKAELREAHPEALVEAGAVRLDGEIPGCEPVAALLARVHGALADLAGRDGPVLVVAHNGSLRAALALLGVADLAAVAGSSVEHLRPFAADLAGLLAPGDVLGG